MSDLHIISTGMQEKDEFIDKATAIAAHVDYVHLREKNWRAEEYLAVIDRLIQGGLPREKIIINDRVDIAVTERLGGVQLATHSLPVEKVKENFPHLLVGCSVHSVEEAMMKEKLGADYLIYGHIFQTNSKAGSPPRGLKALRHLAMRVDIPVIAIGGIEPTTIQAIMDNKASGVAVLSGILLANDSLSATLKYREALNTNGRYYNEFTH